MSPPILKVRTERRQRDLVTGEWSEWTHFHTFTHKCEDEANLTRTLYTTSAFSHSLTQYRAMLVSEEPTIEK